MKGTARFTVSVPADLLEAIDEKLVKEEEGRSALVRRLLEQALQEMQDAEDEAQWIRAYTEQPQTEDELGYLDIIAAQHLGELE